MAGDINPSLLEAFFAAFDGPHRARWRCDTMRAHARGETRTDRWLDHETPRWGTRRAGARLAPTCRRFARLRLCWAEMRARLAPSRDLPRPGVE